MGFSIPITNMFRGSIVWRGIMYTVPMAFAKLVCGLRLIRFPESPGSGKPLSQNSRHCVCRIWR
ncbi:hypothetical protein BDU57DRAFT_518565 [Ampelomyces quisqualis]|uniref:Uncharacterized protein n=1 Tax=Ampelomyces quisqualis TaxID=50730 RepID=A0A6A5QLK4_AMPQU|nr:hypothetical protein BDU57DRAFT_518565 [Ampelomyces quisqualis]